HSPAALRGGRRAWGLSAQIYSLRRGGDQGIGDFTTLGLLGEGLAARGGAILGFNPLHARFSGDRERTSPYYPSDRRFLDPIYLDLNHVPFATDPDVGGPAPVDPAMIDYPGVWKLKLAALEAS